MVRTATPANIKNTFLTGVKNVRDTFKVTQHSELEPSSKKLISEYSFLASVVLLEGFLSDLFIAYINKDSSKFVCYLTNKMEIKTEPNNVWVKEAAQKPYTKITMPKHLTVSEIRSIIDTREYNVTFKDTNEMKEYAGLWLASQHKSLFMNLEKSHCSAINASRAIRNFLAHRSQSSKKEMQSKTIDSSLPTVLKRGSKSITDVAAYLRARSGNETRLEEYLDIFKNIANILCPSN